MMSSKRTVGAAGGCRRSGAASTAQASDAQEARMARFSWDVISGSLTTSIGVRKPRRDGGDGLDRSPFGSRFASLPYPSQSDMGRHEREAPATGPTGAPVGGPI